MIFDSKYLVLQIFNVPLRFVTVTLQKNCYLYSFAGIH